MFNARYATDPLRVALSLMAGAATYVLMGALVAFARDPGLAAILFPSRPPVFAILFALWGVILIAFGLPLGLLLHKLRLQHWLVAVVVGGAITFLVALAPWAINRPPIGWLAASRNALILAAEGAVAALVMWRIAYRRAVPR
jgi:hypothetical protein